MASFRGAQTVNLSTVKSRLTSKTTKYNYAKEVQTAQTRGLLESPQAKQADAPVRGALQYMIWLIARTASVFFREYVEEESAKMRTLWVSVSWRFEQEAELSEEDKNMERYTGVKASEVHKGTYVGGEQGVMDVYWGTSR